MLDLMTALDGEKIGGGRTRKEKKKMGSMDSGQCTTVVNPRDGSVEKDRGWWD